MGRAGRARRRRRRQVWILAIGVIVALSGRLAAAETAAAPVTAAPGGEGAGRLYGLGEELSKEARAVLWSMLPQADGWSVGLCLFTRAGQPFSDRLERDVRDLQEQAATPLPVWVFQARTDSSLPAAAGPSAWWMATADPELRYYALLGVTVAPTAFVITPDGVISGYLPGYSAGSKRKLRRLLSRYVTALKSRPVAALLTDGLDHRKEEFSWKLYRRKMYAAALAQLLHTDTLSVDGRCLLGMLYLQLDRTEEARAAFDEVLVEVAGYRPALLGLSITALRAGNRQAALDYLVEVGGQIPERYRQAYLASPVRMPADTGDDRYETALRRLLDTPGSSDR